MSFKTNILNLSFWQGRMDEYKQLMRVDKPIGTYLLLWPTFWALIIASDGQPNWQWTILLALGTFLMRSAGCVINDYFDRDFDHLVERTKNRPFARNAVSEKEALLLTAVLCVLAALCVLPMNNLTKLLCLPALFLALTYPKLKRFFPIPQLYLGLAFSFGIPMAFAAQTGTVPAMAWLMYLANIIWTLAYDTIYAMSDKEDDERLNIQSSAKTFGRYDILISMLSHAVFWGLMAVVGYLIDATWPYWLAWCVAGVLLLKQYFAIRTRDRWVCLQQFIDNNRVGMVIALGLLVQYWF